MTAPNEPDEPNENEPNEIERTDITMKLYYPAVLRKRGDGFFEARFPDLEGCFAAADTLNDCLEEANAAALNWIETELMEFDGELPAVSDISDLELSEGEFVRNMSLTLRLTDGWEE